MIVSLAAVDEGEKNITLLLLPYPYYTGKNKKRRCDEMFGMFLSFIAGHMIYFWLHLESSSFPRPLSSKEEAECLAALGRGDMEARDRLIRHNLRLVAHIVKKYYASSTDQEDLISIGTIGLIKAVNSFDNTKGARFATYAARCIENAILPQMRREMRREYKRARSWRLKQKTAPEECSSGAVFMCFAQFRALR